MPRPVLGSYAFYPRRKQRDYVNQELTYNAISDIIKKTKQEVEASDNDSKDRTTLEGTSAKCEAVAEQDCSNCGVQPTGNRQV